MRPLATVRSPLANTHKKSLRNDGESGCGCLNYKSLNHRKIIRKAHKNNNVLKTKRMLKRKYKLSGRPVFTISLPGGQLAPLVPLVTPLAV